MDSEGGEKLYLLTFRTACVVNFNSVVKIQLNTYELLMVDFVSRNTGRSLLKDAL